MKRFDYSPLGKELRAQTSAAEKQFQKLYKVFESNKKKKIIKKSRAKSYLVYNKDFTFKNTAKLKNLFNVIFIPN